MYGPELPKENLLIPLLNRQYASHNGIIANLTTPSSRFLGTFPSLHVLQHKDGETLNDVIPCIDELIKTNESVLRERDSAGRSPFHLICCVPSPGQTDAVRSMCSAESAKFADSINVLDTMHRTPLHYALNPFNLEYYCTFPGHGDCLISLIRLLLELGANVNYLDIQGVAPIHLALDFHETGFPGKLKELPTVLEILKNAGADLTKLAYTMSCRNGATREIRSSLTPLHLACRMDGYESISAIKVLLSPETVNCTDSLGRTPLHTVIMSMNKHPKKMPFVRDTFLPSECNSVIEKINLLLESGADVNLDDVDGNSPLLTAIEQFNYEHSVEIIKILLSNGAIATRRDREQRNTPLHLACQYFDRSLPEMLPYFIRAGARLNVPDYKLCTPFHKALKKRCCSVATLRYLVDSGANVTAVDARNNNCLHMVCSSRQAHFRSIVEFLVEKGCGVNDVNIHGNTPLLHLLQSDYNAESVQALVDFGANCKVTNFESISPLHLLCRYLAPSKSNIEIIDLMIKNGADVNARDRSMSTPLFYAVKDEPTVDPDVVHLLLIAGANPNFANDIGATPLHVVSSYGNPELVKMLLAYGANVNQVNSDGKTPLHEAVQARHGKPRRACQILVGAGANVAAKNYTRCTPFLLSSLYSDSYRFLMGHIFLLIYYGKTYSLSQSERNLLNSDKTLAKFYADCFSCVPAIKFQRLGNSRVTLLDFLLASTAEARRYARNPTILHDLYSIADRGPRFRPYSTTIKDKAMECEYFIDLTNRSLLSLEKIFPEFNIPVIVGENILSFLNEFEMKSLNVAVLGR